MSICPEAVPRPEHSRHALHARMDGDFDLRRLLAAGPPAGRADGTWRATPAGAITEAAVNARLWRLPAPGAPDAGQVIPAPLASPARGPRDSLPLGPVSPAEVRLLHSFETCVALRPPVADNCGALSAERARAWLALAAYWIGVTGCTGDLRFFNAACKLLGAVCASPAGGSRAISGQIDCVARLACTATTELAARLAGQLPDACSPQNTAPDWRPAQKPGGAAGARPGRIVLLAGEGSGTAGRLAGMADAAGVRLARVCWFAQPSSWDTASSYADAWCPAEQPPRTTTPAIAIKVAQDRAGSWDQVSDILRAQDADLVILAGMPIVPADVLRLAHVGVINAHNGALPGYRGMDAVAWAILDSDPITCTLHLAEPGPDRGAVLGAVTVPFAPAGTLRARVKESQLRMLIAAAAHVRATGSLPAATPQPAGDGRQFYRLHPHLKRILDSSPYGTATTPTAGGCPP